MCTRLQTSGVDGTFPRLMKETFRRNRHGRSMTVGHDSYETINASAKPMDKKKTTEVAGALHIIWDELSTQGANGMVDLVNKLRQLDASSHSIGEKLSWKKTHCSINCTVAIFTSFLLIQIEMCCFYNQSLETIYIICIDIQHFTPNLLVPFSEQHDPSVLTLYLATFHCFVHWQLL